jgi:protein SCO1/2
MNKETGTQANRYTGKQVYKYTSTQAPKHTNILFSRPPANLFTCVLVYLSTFLTACLPTFLLALAACAPPASLQGTDLGKDPAPDFSLTTETGKTVALSDLRGKVVVLTFLYTHCPDICPLTAEHLRIASDQLGNAMDRVAFVAVSVDPRNDTPGAVQEFIREHRLSGKLTYLIGTPDRLGPVWSAYYVAAEAGTSSPQLITHSSRVILIDKKGQQRVNMDSDFDPPILVQNVRILLNE